jgi:hypothetical protein
MSNRSYGVEIEIAGLSEEQAYLVLRLAKVDVHDPGRGSSGSAGKWKLHSDNSIRDPRASANGTSTRTCEVVSPVLSGTDGLKQIRKVVTALKKYGAYVNESCGLHVHVGAQDLDAQDAKAICSRYKKYQPTIDKFFIANRREGRNSYCIGVDSVVDICNQQRRSNTIRDIANMINNRYHAVNLCAYTKHGTIEFRQHHGTLNAAEITNWVCFILGFVETSRGVASGESTSFVNEPTTPIVHEGRKAVFAALKAAGSAGLSEPEILAVTSTCSPAWTVVSVNIDKMRNQNGLLIDDFTANGIRKYRLTAPPARPANIQPIKNDRSLFLGIPKNVGAHLRKRVIANTPPCARQSTVSAD